jgi:RNA-directed DNA polymerase
MPEADFCSAVRSPYGHLSRRSDTEQISWGKFSHFPCTIAESTFRTLMDVDFAVSRPLVRRVEGTPQGGPLSPLLSNLVLDELDRELERRGHRYLRYADDCNIYVRSQRAGQRVMEGITRFITHKLKLKVNEAKSAVARPQERKILGFSFSTGSEVKRIIAPKALERFKHRIREVTRRAKGVSMEKTIAELAPYMRGWRSYFGFCETPDVLTYLTRWVRLRLRAAMWRQWRTPRRRRAALLALGVRPRLATNTAGSGRGPWYLARAKALSVGLSNAYFKSLGLPTLIDGC